MNQEPFVINSNGFAPPGAAVLWDFGDADEVGFMEGPQRESQDMFSGFKLPSRRDPSDADLLRAPLDLAVLSPHVYSQQPRQTPCTTGGNTRTGAKETRPTCSDMSIDSRPRQSFRVATEGFPINLSPAPNLLSSSERGHADANRGVHVMLPSCQPGQQPLLPLLNSSSGSHGVRPHSDNLSYHNLHNLRVARGEYPVHHLAATALDIELDMISEAMFSSGNLPPMVTIGLAPPACAPSQQPFSSPESNPNPNRASMHTTPFQLGIWTGGVNSDVLSNPCTSQHYQSNPRMGPEGGVGPQEGSNPGPRQVTQGQLANGVHGSVPSAHTSTAGFTQPSLNMHMQQAGWEASSRSSMHSHGHIQNNCDPMLQSLALPGGALAPSPMAVDMGSGSGAEVKQGLSRDKAVQDVSVSAAGQLKRQGLLDSGHGSAAHGTGPCLGQDSVVRRTKSLCEARGQAPREEDCSSLSDVDEEEEATANQPVRQHRRGKSRGGGKTGSLDSSTRLAAEKNRSAQRRFRDRQKAKVEELERAVNSLTERLQTVMRSNSSLRSNASVLEASVRLRDEQLAALQAQLLQVQNSTQATRDRCGSRSDLNAPTMELTQKYGPHVACSSGQALAAPVSANASVACVPEQAPSSALQSAARTHSLVQEYCSLVQQACKMMAEMSVPHGETALSAVVQRSDEVGSMLGTLGQALVRIVHELALHTGCELHTLHLTNLEWYASAPAPLGASASSASHNSLNMSAQRTMRQQSLADMLVLASGQQSALSQAWRRLEAALTVHNKERVVLAQSVFSQIHLSAMSSAADLLPLKAATDVHAGLVVNTSHHQRAFADFTIFCWEQVLLPCQASVLSSLAWPFLPDMVFIGAVLARKVTPVATPDSSA